MRRSVGELGPTGLRGRTKAPPTRRNLIWVMPAEGRVQEELIVIVAGGGGLRPDVAALLADGARVLAADGGLGHALALGLEPEAVIGDLDSASPDAVEAASRKGVRIVRHPTAKDATDLELVLDEALALAPARVLVLLDGGGRLDHLLSALLLLGAARYAEVQLDAQVGDALVHVVRSARELEGRNGETVSLLALHGPAEGVTTEGLAFPLAGETLEPGSSRGVSNVFAAERAHVQIRHGVLLVIRPGLESRATEVGL
jgi:thiamine pyrophosphokinase